MNALHALVPGLLDNLGFPLLEYEEGHKNPRVQNAHRYYEVGAGYKSSYDLHNSLRPELKLELVHRTPLLPTESRQFGYLYERLAGMPPSSPATIECISISETAAEKVISLLRRCAWCWDGKQRGETDAAIVRHIYDVARIAELSSDSLGAARAIFPQLVANERDEWAGQHPEFDRKPVEVLKRALAKAKESDELKARYETRLLPLVYDEIPATFEDSFKLFEGVAHDLLAACDEVPPPK